MRECVIVELRRLMDEKCVTEIGVESIRRVVFEVWDERARGAPPPSFILDVLPIKGEKYTFIVSYQYKEATGHIEIHLDAMRAN